MLRVWDMFFCEGRFHLLLPFTGFVVRELVALLTNSIFLVRHKSSLQNNYSNDQTWTPAKGAEKIPRVCKVNLDLFIIEEFLRRYVEWF